MTDKEIQKGNKLIAEFMGWEKGATEEMYDFPENFSSFLVDEYHEILPKSMKFHSSWNWLMPVVEKIESIKNITTGLTQGDFSQRYSSEHDTENIVVFDTIEVVMQSNNCGIIPLKDSDYIEGDPIVSCDGKTKFDATYKAVVGFIKWYNDKNK